MIRLFFDTETNGRPGVDKWEIFPLEIAAILEDSENPSRRQYLVGLLNWPELGFHPQISDFLIGLNGIRPEQLHKGLHPLHTLNNFHRMIHAADEVIAHNTEFDWKITQLWETKFLSGIEGSAAFFNGQKAFCTMQASTELCRLPNSRGGFKWPKLQELHQFLFGSGFEGAHGALADTLAARKCYHELQRRGITESPYNVLRSA